MGMFDTAVGALDTASQMLAGGAATPGTAVDGGDPTYTRGQNIDADAKTESAAQAPNLENALNGYRVIEFIHFGFVHTSHCNFFVHEDDFSDADKNDQLKADAKPRAIQFRSGLEREAILLSLFMERTQAVLQERQDSSALGGIGAALDTLGSLTGATGGGSGQMGPGDLNALIQKVAAATKPVLPDSIEYKNTLQAGIDLHKARWDYRALLKKLVEESPAAGAGGLLNQLPGLSSVGGTFGNLVSFAQGVATKAPDVKAKFFALTALQQEPQIELACNEMTLKAIRTLANPFLPVWFADGSPPPGVDTWKGMPDDPLQSHRGSKYDPLIDFAQPTVDNERGAVRDLANQGKSFFEHGPPGPPPPGQDALGLAFKNPPTAKGGDPSLVPMAMGDVACQAFFKALDLKTPLGFPETVVSAIVGLALEFVQTTYKVLLTRSKDDPITSAAVVKAAADDFHLAKRLEDIALSKLTALKKLKETTTPEIPHMPGFTVRPGDMVDKGVGKLDEVVAGKIAPLLNPIIEYAMGEMAEKLESSRADGVALNCYTMEWYLGRLPWFQATLFCDLFFPFWNALMRVASDVIGGPVGSVLKTIVGIADKAKGAVDGVRNKIAEGEALKDAVGKTVESYSHVDQGTDFKQKSRDREKLFNDAENTTAAQTSAPAAPDAGNFTIPVTGRSDTGQGQNISAGDYDEVSPNHQWDKAWDGTEPKKDEAAAPAGNGGTP